MFDMDGLLSLPMTFDWDTTNNNALKISRRAKTKTKTKPKKQQRVRILNDFDEDSPEFAGYFNSVCDVTCLLFNLCSNPCIGRVGLSLYNPPFVFPPLDCRGRP